MSGTPLFDEPGGEGELIDHEHEENDDLDDGLDLNDADASALAMATTPSDPGGVVDEHIEENVDDAYSPGTPTTAEEPMAGPNQDSSAPTPTKDEDDSNLKNDLSRSLSPVSNISLPPGDPDRLEEVFSSLSSDDDAAIEIPATVAPVDLEDGEILTRRREEEEGERRRSHTRSPLPHRRSAASGGYSPKRNTAAEDLPRYDVRYLINRKRNMANRGGGDRDNNSYRSRSRSISPRSRSRRRPRRSSSKSRSPRRAASPPFPSRKASYRRGGASPSPPPSKKKRKHLASAPVVTKKKRRRRSRSSSFSRSRSRSRSKSPKKKTKKKNSTTKKTGTKTGKKKAGKSLTTKKKGKASRTPPMLAPSSSSNPVVVTEKEVFASGDKILVSVNFKQSQQPPPATRTVTKEKKKKKKKKKEDLNGPNNKVAVAAAQKQKPVMVIDVMSSPYQVFESSPTEVIDVNSDEEKENSGRGAADANSGQTGSTPMKNNGDKANGGNDIGLLSESDVEDLVLSPPPSNNNFHKGPCTPPADDNETLDLAKGPQTPEDSIDTYDPCDPTESPELDESLGSGNGSNNVTNGSNGGNGGKAGDGSSGNGKIPFLSDELASIFQCVKDSSKRRAAKQDKADIDLSAMDSLMDMDVDSPCSPQGSDLSDLFEPPSASKGNRKAKSGHRNGMKAKGKKLRNKSTVQMKLIDDKLKIIDDVPTSAVEMAVKEKFLRKVQRQERIVDEIKAVLKPFYNKKKISKDSYKEIMRKCVPKVCHSKTGAINTTKIQKLVRGYVRKYKFAEKKGRPFMK